MITFSNIHSVNLYLNSPLEWGNFTIKFDNILENNDFGYGKEGSVVVYGDVEYCYNPCTENSTSDNCNMCDPSSTLTMEFDRQGSQCFVKFKNLLEFNTILISNDVFQFGDCNV